MMFDFPEVCLRDAEATARLGATLAGALAPLGGAVIHLQGDLGAGKTTLARGLLEALGVTGRIRSPTYTLMEPYLVDGRSVLHMDLYRLADPLELQNLGLADYPPDRSLWLVEWPDKGGELLPPPDLQIELVLQGEGRAARLRSRADFALRDAFLSTIREFLKLEH